MGKRSMRKDDVAHVVDAPGISEDLVAIVNRAMPGIQQETNFLSRPDCPEAKNLILVVIDGTSPLAYFAPESVRRGGNSRTAVRLMSRSEVARFLAVDFKPMAQRILEGPGKDCGHDDHLEYLVSNDRGGAIRCVECDLGVTPKIKEPKRKPS